MKAALAALVMVAALGTAGQAMATSAYQVGQGVVIRTTSGELATAEGRAAFLAVVERSARKLCDGVQPRRDRDACEARTAADLEAQARPGLARAIRMARLERDGATGVAMTAR
jgi:UrcA family protein